MVVILLYVANWPEARKDVWETLSEDQKKQVIVDYNKLEAEKQKQNAKLREKELENEAKLAPYKAIADAIELVGDKSKNSDSNNSQKLVYIDTTFNKLKTKNGKVYSVSFSDSRIIKNWKAGEKIITSKNPSYEFYKINIVNLDRKEAINANSDVG